MHGECDSRFVGLFGVWLDTANRHLTNSRKEMRKIIVADEEGNEDIQQALVWCL